MVKRARLESKKPEKCMSDSRAPAPGRRSAIMEKREGGVWISI